MSLSGAVARYCCSNCPTHPSSATTHTLLSPAAWQERLFRKMAAGCQSPTKSFAGSTQITWTNVQRYWWHDKLTIIWLTSSWLDRVSEQSRRSLNTVQSELSDPIDQIRSIAIAISLKVPPSPPT